MDPARPWAHSVGVVRGKPGRGLAVPPLPPPPIPADELEFRGVRLSDYSSLEDAVRKMIAAFRTRTGYRRPVTKEPKDLEVLVHLLLRQEEVDPVHYVNYVCSTHLAKYGAHPYPGQVFAPTAVAGWLPEYRRRAAHYWAHVPRRRG